MCLTCTIIDIEDKQPQIVAILFFFTLVIAPLVLNQPPQSSRYFASLSETSASKVKVYEHELEIVVAHYHESLEKLNRTLNEIKLLPAFVNLKPYTVVYTKGEDHFHPLNLTQMQDTIGADALFHLPNFGREGDTYLHHMINNYGRLAHWTLFMQAEPHDFDLFAEIVNTHFDNSTGLLPLHRWKLCDCGEHCDNPSKQLKEVYAMLTHELCPGNYSMFFRGQFLVSEERITRNSIATLQYMRDLLTANMSHWIHNNGRPDYTDNPTDPFFGHILERSWSLLFNCYQESITNLCNRTLQYTCQCIN